MNLIIGAGAVGSILAAYLSKARQKTKLLVREKDLIQAREAQQLRVDRIQVGPPLKVPAPGLTTSINLDDIQQVFICVKYPDFPDILAALPEDIPEHITLLPCLNGISASRQLREKYPNNKIAPVTIMFNGQLLEPLHAQITTKPDILIYSDDDTLLQLFNGSGMSATHAKDESVAWGKLLINLNNGICALTHTTFKDLLVNKDLTASFVSLLDEATQVLDAANIAYKLPIPIQYSSYRWILLHGGKAPWWFAKLKNGLTDQSFPSMVADIERRRPTEVDQLNGEIVRLGAQLAIPTPVNAKICSLIRNLEQQSTPNYLSATALRNAIR